MNVGRRRGALAAAAAACIGLGATPALGAVQPLLPVADGKVAPLGAFQVRFTAGEFAPALLLYRGADGAGEGMTITTSRHPQSDGTTVLKAEEPIPPGRWFWTVTTTAPRGSAEAFPRSPLLEVTVPRVVRMTEVRFARRGAQVTARYVWRTNAPRLIHRTEVRFNGRRVRSVQSTIAHSESRRMAGESFTASAALTRNRPPFGRIHAGTWVVRVSISDGTKTVARSKRYVIR
ncbi:MAG: hypothetical protein AB7V42_06050 [Thermoleophilia bacterium]